MERPRSTELQLNKISNIYDLAQNLAQEFGNDRGKKRKVVARPLDPKFFEGANLIFVFSGYMPGEVKIHLEEPQSSAADPTISGDTLIMDYLLKRNKLESKIIRLRKPDSAVLEHVGITGEVDYKEIMKLESILLQVKEDLVVEREKQRQRELRRSQRLVESLKSMGKHFGRRVF